MAKRRTAQTNCQRDYPEERSEPFPPWVETAFRMYCRGQRNWTQLGKQFDVDPRTVKSNVIKFGAVVRAAGSGSGVDAWQEALTAHEEILGEAWRIHASPDASAAEKLQALKVAQTSIEQVAVLNGVATKRASVAVGQDPNLGPMQVQQSGRLELTGDAALAVLAFHENAEPEVDELHPAPADAEAGGLPEPEQP